MTIVSNAFSTSTNKYFCMTQTVWHCKKLTTHCIIWALKTRGYRQRAAARGVTPTAFALGWVWNNRLVHGVIAGPKTLDQWQGYVDAIGQPFDAEDEAGCVRLAAIMATAI